MNRGELDLLAARWRRQRAVVTAMWSAAAAGASAAALLAWRVDVAVLSAALVATTVALMRSRRSPRIDAAAVAAHLDRTFSRLQESAGLWLRAEEDLAPIERLQRRRIDVVWRELRVEQPRAGEPTRRAWRWPVAALVGASALLGVANVFRSPPRGPEVADVAMRASSSPAEAVEVAVRTLRVTVAPPEYLGLPPYQVEVGDLEVPEGARLRWEIETLGAPKAVRLEGVLAGEPLIAEPVGEGRFRAEATVEENRLYRIAMIRADESVRRGAATHVIKVTRDLAPRLSWREPVQPRTLLDPAGAPRLKVALEANDDHALGDGILVVTVAKGSGEGVKFREVQRPLRRVLGTDPRSAVYSDELDLNAFQLEPGDEVYFHALVSDRRLPRSNTARSETRFVVLRGSDVTTNAPVGALAGVNRLPPFFRSQRQVILDTERLIAERGKLDEAAWLARSQEIGVDQKLLRLRYGQFLGEEFEPDSLGAPREAEAMAMAGRLRTRSAGAPGAAVQEAAIARAIEASHDHPVVPPSEKGPATVESLAAAFVHRHDNPEAATLFDTTVQASLRGVLAAMWEAEGALRSGRPVAALPAENRALELLKALQQADRVYVRRTGFEPAPLKEEERRLRGELGTIPQFVRAAPAAPDAARQAAMAREGAVRRAIADLSKGVLVEAAGRDEIELRLAEAARRDPARHLAALEIWRRGDSRLEPQDERTVVAALLALLPEGSELPAPRAAADAALVRRYFGQLQRLEEPR